MQAGMQRRVTPAVPEIASASVHSHNELTDHAAPEAAEPYMLVAFSPWYGIGLFEFCRVRHVFDLASPAIAGDYGKRLDLALAEAKQMRTERPFACLRQLLVCCRQQYLREQKNGLYSILFTSRLARRPAEKALALLNEREFCQFPVSRMAISVLKEVAIPKYVAECIINADHLDFRNVKASLAGELWELVFCRRVEAALKALSKDGRRLLAELRGIRQTLAELEDLEDAGG